MRFFILSYCLITLVSCQHSYSPKEIVGYVNNPENGMKRTYETDDISFELLYKPSLYIAILEEKEKSTEESVNNRVKELEGLQYYNLKIINKSGSDLLKYKLKEEKEYYNRLNYLSTFLKNDIRLIQGEDTLKPVLYQFERNYGLAPFCTSVFAFKETDLNLKKDKELIIKDQVFSNQEIHFILKNESLKELPNIEY